MRQPERPIGAYVRLPPELLPWDPRLVHAAAAVTGLILERRPDLEVHHIGSTAVPRLPGKGIVDLTIPATSDEIPAIVADLKDLGFGDQVSEDPWPPTRPMLVGSIDLGDGSTFRVHLHVVPGRVELSRDIAFRDALRADPALVEHYATLKRGIVEGGLIEGHQYTYQKQAWINETQRNLGFGRPPISPPATIGILGGGQLGRMLALAARAMGYRIAVLDPDPDCPTASIADRIVVGGYDDVGAALRLASVSDVVTYELEHIAAEVVEAVAAVKPVRPGRVPLTVTQDRLAERRFAGSIGVEVAPWHEVSTTAELAAAAADLGFPLRLKVAIGGYDGRGQLRLASPDEIDGAIARLGRPPGEALLVEGEMAFDAEISIIVARTADGPMTTYPVALNVHDAGILAESVAPAPVSADTAARAAELGKRLAIAMGLIGTLTAELFHMPNGRIVVNELAPRVHNSGHWTLDGAATSQFEQHIRAICGLELGSTEALRPTAMVNLWGAGRLREARLDPASVGQALGDPLVHLHLYDKRRVFERRKMGHVTATGASTDEALARARAARDALRWLDSDDLADGDLADGE